MVSLAQIRKSNELASKGWFTHEVKNPAMGGPIIMESPNEEFVQVLSDGSVQPYSGAAVKTTVMGELKRRVVLDGKIVS